MEIKIQPDLPFKGKGIQNSRTGRIRKSEKPDIDNPADGSFLSVLEEILPSNRAENQTLQELWSQLPGTEKEFLGRPNEENLQIYKDLIMNIAQRTIERNLKVVKYKRQRPGMEDKELHVVRILDQKLAQMLSLIRSPENSAFALLRQMDEIRGLLYAAKA